MCQAIRPPPPRLSLTVDQLHAVADKSLVLALTPTAYYASTPSVALSDAAIASVRRLSLDCLSVCVLGLFW